MAHCPRSCVRATCCPTEASALSTLCNVSLNSKARQVLQNCWSACWRRKARTLSTALPIKFSASDLTKRRNERSARLRIKESCHRELFQSRFGKSVVVDGEGLPSDSYFDGKRGETPWGVDDRK